MITLSQIWRHKLKNKLLLSFFIIFTPLILISKTIVFILSRKFDEIILPLNTLYALIALDILFFLLALVIFAYLLSRSVTKPLKKFTDTIGNSKEGDCSIRLHYKAGDEIGSLARYFNEFMIRMEKYHDRLNEKDLKTMEIRKTLKAVEKERCKLLIQLQKSQKMEAIGTLAGGIAHDFNNILSSIFGYAQLAQMTGGDQEKLNIHMNQILKSAQRAAELIEQILTFSRQTEDEKRPLKLHLVVKEALKLLRASIPATIEMVTQVETTDMVHANPTQMHQMVVHLCTNAYHAMITSGGTLTVSLTTVDEIQFEHQSKDYFQPGPFLKFMVKDTSTGMNQETLEETYEEDSTTDNDGQEAGLGFTLIETIVKDHNGLSYIERITGQGTSFFVYLPIVTKSVSSAGRLTGMDVSLKTGKETIMIVEDEHDLLVLIEELLRKFGYSVHPFNNGKSALDAYQRAENNFDMVITDMTMPHMTGIALAEAILSINENMPIILCSGYNETISNSRIKSIGIQAFLKKPLDTSELLNTIRMVLDK
nr:response regulator [uncultured Desulfobacter sp.]